MPTISHLAATVARLIRETAATSPELAKPAIESFARDYFTLAENLTAVQARCTELLLENRRLRGVEPELRYRRVLDVPVPSYATSGSVGLDVTAAGFVFPPTSDEQANHHYDLAPGQAIRLRTGLCLEIPDGYEVSVRPRSSSHMRRIHLGFGTIDQDYRGEVHLVATNLGHSPTRIALGERLGQFVMSPVARPILIEVDELSDTMRGAGGFGSSGR